MIVTSSKLIAIQLDARKREQLGHLAKLFFFAPESSASMQKCFQLSGYQNNRKLTHLMRYGNDTAINGRADIDGQFAFY